MNDTTNSPTNDFDEIDLLAELGKATEEKIPATATPTAQGSTTGQGDDLNAVQEAANAADFTTEPAQPSTLAAQATSKLAFPPEKMAGLVLDGLDSMFEHAFPYLYTQSMDKADRVAMKLLVRKYRDAKGKQSVTLTGEDQRIMELMLDYEDYCEGLPLDEDERKTLQEPLKEVLKTANYQTSPGNALLLSVLIIVLPRMAPLFKNMITKT